MLPPAKAAKLLALAFCGYLNPVLRPRRPLSIFHLRQNLEVSSASGPSAEKLSQLLRSKHWSAQQSKSPAMSVPSSTTARACANNARVPATSGVGPRVDRLGLETAAEVYRYLRGRWDLKKSIDYKVGGMAGTWEGVASFSPQQQQSNGAAAAPETDAVLDQLERDTKQSQSYSGGDSHRERPDESRVLRYLERGVFKINGVGEGFQAGQRLVYDCGNPSGPVRVYFVDDPQKPNALRFFHELDFRTTPGISTASAPGATFGGGRDGRPGEEEGGVRGSGRCHGEDEANPAVSRSARAEFEHLCVRDLYRGEVEVLGKDEFRTRWHVTGPQKDGKIHATYRRRYSEESYVEGDPRALQADGVSYIFSTIAHSGAAAWLQSKTGLGDTAGHKDLSPSRCTKRR